MAEAVFQAHLQQHTSTSPSAQLLVAHIDSAGTDAYHAGAAPDPRTLATLAENGLTTYRHQARKVRADDFTRFQYVLAMDEENLEDLVEMRARVEKNSARKGGRSGQREGEALAKVMLFGEFGGRGREVVVDPYYDGGADGFRVAFEQMGRFSEGLLRVLETEGSESA